MTGPFTPAYIAELRALAEKATPGPWRQHLVDDTTVVDRFGEEIAQTFPEGGNNDDVDFATNTEQREDDAAFIAAARDALPRALDTIEAQAAEIAERDAEIARLRGALRVVADNLSTVLMHGLPTGLSADPDENDSEAGRLIGIIASTQAAYAALAGVSIAEWVAVHPGIYDSPLGEIVLAKEQQT